MRIRVGVVSLVPTSTITVPMTVLVTMLLAACSEGDVAAPPDGPTTTPLAAPDTAQVASPPDSLPESSTSMVDGSSSGTAGASAESIGSGPATTFAVVEVPETGVPGLDSDDSFCAAWSRFGGSWQVIQVAANFAPDPSVVPAIEVVAAPVVDRAYDAMFAAWPAELADEREAVADGFFGPLERRAEVALDALDRAGADDDDLDALASAWVAALAARQPDEPVLAPELTDELRELVDVAAADFADERVAFVDDPSMRIVVQTPTTDAYLATACPDQGALTGTEVGEG